MENENLKNAASSDASPVFASPTLTSLAVEHSQLLPKDNPPVCVNCPNAIWMVTRPTMLQCYCKPMMMVSWTSMKEKDKMAVVLCDGIFLTDETEEDSALTEDPTPKKKSSASKSASTSPETTTDGPDDEWPSDLPEPF